MSDSCKHCIVRGDIKACAATPCNTHDSWYAQQLQRRTRKLEALVESSYREGFTDGYDDDARPQDADAGWEHSEARRELEPPR